MEHGKLNTWIVGHSQHSALRCEPQILHFVIMSRVFLVDNLNSMHSVYMHYLNVKKAYYGNFAIPNIDNN